MDFTKRSKKRKLISNNNSEESGDEANADMNEIYINNNHIYFSGDITSKSSFLLCKNIRMLECELRIEEVEKMLKMKCFYILRRKVVVLLLLFLLLIVWKIRVFL